LNKEWQGRLELVSREITKIPGVNTEYFIPSIANHVPHMHIIWDSRISLTPQQVSQLLRNSKPSIVMAAGEERPGLGMNSFMLQPGEDQIVAEQLSRILRQHLA
jgi:D-glucosaminate-6-phosphate ammonia-lyase